MNPSRADFCHPYQPYDIQLEFMRRLYQSAEHGQVAIFESPTGTGKSLSLICGALTWLRDNSRRQIEGDSDDHWEDGGNDWLMAAERSAHKRELLQELAEREQKLSAIRKKEIGRQEAIENARLRKKARLDDKGPLSKQPNDDEFLLDEYLSDGGASTSRHTEHSLSTSTLALLDKLNPVTREDVEPEDERIKIIFCSRTHSQLTQFINELRRVTPPPGLPRLESMSNFVLDEEVVKHIALGSRKNLCINEKVSRLPSTLAINEKCLELQKPGTSKERKCQYLPGRNDKGRIEIFKDRAIATIRDIEDLGELGRKMEICPYYASRAAIPSVEILTLPYPLLLQKSARDALGVQVKDNIVVIDEAHNLMDAIADTLSVSLSLSQLDLATKQVISYVQRFKNKLKGSNRMYLTQVIRLLNSFTDCLRGTVAAASQKERAVTATDLMAGKGVDQIRLHKLLHYLNQSKLAHKVERYIDAHDENTASTRPKGILMHFQSFLTVLMNPDSEGRFFVVKQEGDVAVRYVLLDPREHFRDIVEQARAVILAGGTMSPMSDYADYLFSYLESSRLSTYSFGHIVPKENILARSITRGPTNVEFDFTYNQRSNPAMIRELGMLLIRICRRVPDGVVVFFPSYDYLDLVCKAWSLASTDQPIIATLSSIKTVFKETRDTPSETLLLDYAQAIDNGPGSVMFSVVGGKLSEGINFSDKLGRAVVAVGLPFPNIQSAEWKAKMEHVEQMKYKKCRNLDGLSKSESQYQAKSASRDFYENACMRAVNQSIGRAIRHKDDYAAILLLDRRFSTTKIQNKLPQWIRGSMGSGENAEQWSVTENDLEHFYHDKQRSDGA